MASDLIGAMIDNAGFRMDGLAMVKHANGCTIVVTATDGGLPCEEDFLVCVYQGDWTADPSVPELIALTLQDIGEAPESGLAPIDEALQRADAEAAKEAGQRAYDAYVRRSPTYPGGGARMGWLDLSDEMRDNWRRYPASRDWRR